MNETTVIDSECNILSPNLIHRKQKLLSFIALEATSELVELVETNTLK